MAYLNKIMLIARVTNDPEAPRTLQNGAQVITFRVAAGKSKKNRQTGQWENDPNPLYIDCEAWTQSGASFSLVKLVQEHASKGKELFIEGELKLDQWEDKTSGQKRSKHKIWVSGIQLLGGPSHGTNGGSQQGQQRQSQMPASNPDADAPGDYGNYPSTNSGDEIPF